MRRVLVAGGRAEFTSGPRQGPIRVAVLTATLNDARAVLEAARASGLAPEVVQDVLRALIQSS